MTARATLRPDDVQADFEVGVTGVDPREILRFALDRFRDRIALVTSFQAEGMVLLDLALRIDRTVPVITLDTGRLPEATRRFIERVDRHYGIRTRVVFPDPGDLERLVREGGPNGFFRSVEGRLACCRARKVLPLDRALEPFGAWISGLRRDQHPTRSAITQIDADPVRPGKWKLHPLASWSGEQVEGYLERWAVPRHPYYAKGYTSIGCEPCTRPPVGADERSGRWWWEASAPKECGLHFAGGSVRGVRLAASSAVDHRAPSPVADRRAAAGGRS